MDKNEIIFLLVLLSSIFIKNLILIHIQSVIFMIFFPPFSKKNGSHIKIISYVIINILLIVIFILKKRGG